MHGGKRANSGRKPGAVARILKANERVSKTLDAGVTPLDYLLSVMRGKGRVAMRVEAAKAAAPYIHRKQPQDISLDATGLPQIVTIVVPPL